jgi:hypothetical protein
MTPIDPRALADRCENFMNGTKRLFDGERLSGTKGDMWFFELYHHLDACAAALRKSPVQAAPRSLSEEEIAALIREHVEVGYTLGEGGLVDPDTIFVNAAGAAHVIAHGPHFPEFLRQRDDGEPFECPEPITCQFPTCGCGATTNEKGN